MGICSSQMMTQKPGTFITLPSTTTVKIIHHKDGTLQEFNQPIKARQILSQNPNTFLCSSEYMYVDSIVPQLPDDEGLELEHLYFLMPISLSSKPLSLHDLCDLAIKASLALSYSLPSQSPSLSALSSRSGFRFVAQARRYCKSTARINVSRTKSAPATPSASWVHMIKLKGF